MSELKDKLTKEVSEIDNTISNPEEKTKVLSIIQEMIGDFTKHIVTLTERQNEMEERLGEIYEMLSDIEAELIQNLSETLQAECPYCGELIPLELNDEGDIPDFECPICHNLIEMEMILDNHHCDCGCEDCEEEDLEEFEGCDGHCEHCEGHHDVEDEE